MWYVVVQTQIVGNAHDYEFVSWEVSRHRSLTSAKRAGIRALGHDDFNIAILDNRDRLHRWTWMGEECEGAVPEDMAAYAERLGWQLAS